VFLESSFSESFTFFTLTDPKSAIVAISEKKNSCFEGGASSCWTKNYKKMPLLIE